MATNPAVVTPTTGVEIRGPLPKPGDRVAALSPDGGLVAVMELRADRRLHPLRVIAPA